MGSNNSAIALAKKPALMARLLTTEAIETLIYLEGSKSNFANPSLIDGAFQKLE